jgi:hypothetical protein
VCDGAHFFAKRIPIVAKELVHGGHHLLINKLEFLLLIHQVEPRTSSSSSLSPELWSPFPESALPSHPTSLPAPERARSVSTRESKPAAGWDRKWRSAAALRAQTRPQSPRTTAAWWDRSCSTAPAKPSEQPDIRRDSLATRASDCSPECQIETQDEEKIQSIFAFKITSPNNKQT